MPNHSTVIRTTEIEIAGKVIKIETGKLAKQANGAVTVTCGETVVLVTAVAAKEPQEGTDFFPLLVDYEEKFYAAGKIPGGFFKREGKPSENAILTSRLIDRPLRPLFPEDYYNDVQIIASVLSYDQANSPDIISIIGASCALYISDIPFYKPIAAVRVGYLNEEYLINPTVEELKESQLNLVVAGTKDSVIMLEGEAKELSEEQILVAIERAQIEIRKIVEMQIKFVQEIRPDKINQSWQLDQALLEEKNRYYQLIKKDYTELIEQSLTTIDKVEREEKLKNLKDEIITHLENELVNSEQEFEELNNSIVNKVFDSICKEIMRKLVVEKRMRVDQRKPDEIRPIACEIGILPRVHGSALFTRGQTQALVITTLGSVRDEQSVDTLEEDTTRKFYLHYNFPPFSVGDVKPRRAQSRREIGHGALAEKAVKALIPEETEFPYTIRVVSEILESNGSSSMATVCGTSLSLMDAGVPIKKSVAGVALGLIKEDDKYEILTDIIGIEDHYGDMDFKAAGSSDGITAIQMDLKIDGVSLDILREILERSRKGRLYILEKMNAVIATPKEELSNYVPKILIMKVSTDKIGNIIGPSGKNIKKIIEESDTSIDIKDNGEIFITADSNEKIEKAKYLIEGLVREVKIGEIYNGKVKRITKYGAFVEILPGVEGLLHISNLSHYHVDKVEDVLNTNDEIQVKVIGIDQQGKVDLSKKELIPRTNKDDKNDKNTSNRYHKRSTFK
ncbi:MAG: polyribonucleotide nucleotidyltransferase [Candidatus Atribacteria bacterium]|nr:polyribonucleotide nucleotidyltransferase [Candidatus Atribacteria bacterium]